MSSVTTGGCDQDTAQHTLEECLAWADQRHVLIDVIGGDSLSAIDAKMVGSEEA